MAFIAPISKEDLAANSEALGDLLSRVLSIEAGIQEQLDLGLGDPRVYANRSGELTAAKERIKQLTTFDQLSKHFPAVVLQNTEVPIGRYPFVIHMKGKVKPPAAIAVELTPDQVEHPPTDIFTRHKTATPFYLLWGTPVPKVPKHFSDRIKKARELNRWGTLYLMFEPQSWNPAADAMYGKAYYSTVGNMLEAFAVWGVIFGLPLILSIIGLLAFGPGLISLLLGCSADVMRDLVAAVIAVPLFIAIITLCLQCAWPTLVIPILSSIAAATCLALQPKKDKPGHALLLFRSDEHFFYIGEWTLAQPKTHNTKKRKPS